MRLSDLFEPKRKLVDVYAGPSSQPLQTTCGVIQTYDGYVVQLEGRTGSRLASRMVAEGSMAFYHTDYLYRKAIGERSDWRPYQTWETFYWSSTTNIVTFKTLTEAIAAAEETEAALKIKEFDRKKAFEYAANKRLEEAARAAFVEKKVWR